MRQKIDKVIHVVTSNKKHIDSSLFLFFINIFNFIFPLLLSPIIISRCGVEGFGVITLFQSVMLFISSITDYGFNINATREVTINHKTPFFANRYFFVVSQAKTILLIIAIILSIVIYVFLPKASEYSLIYFSSLAILIGRAYNPMWVLRAIHKMKFIFYFYVFFKVVSILTVYFFLKDNDDLYIVNLSIGLSDLFTCFFATLILFFNLKWQYFSPSIEALKNEIFSGFAVFTQTLSINANAYLNPMILGFFVDPYSLGIYCVVEKIILVIKFCAAFILQSVFPKACELSIENIVKYKIFMKNLLVFLIGSMTVAGIIIIVFPYFIVSYFIKVDTKACSDLLVFSAWIPLVVAFNMTPYLSFMVFSKQKSTTYIFVMAVFINLIINTLLSKNFGIYGISTGIYITEAFISISLWLIMIVKTQKINFLSN
jgi:O-antigen/teichoic acid export membrane protein